MSAPPTVVSFDTLSVGPTFGNGLGLLLYEQRRLRRANPRQQPRRALSPFASLRQRVQEPRPSAEFWLSKSHHRSARYPELGGDHTMTIADVPILDQIGVESARREFTPPLTDTHHSLDRDHTLGDRALWRVLAQAGQPAFVPERGPDRRLASLDYAAWHAHLAGIRRWVPGSGNH